MGVAVAKNPNITKEQIVKSSVASKNSDIIEKKQKIILYSSLTMVILKQF